MFIAELHNKGLQYRTIRTYISAISFVHKMKDVRDGPFDIQGGGWDFSSRQVIFFPLFAQQVIIFKSKLQQVFYFFLNNTLKPEKCKRKQHIE